MTRKTVAGIIGIGVLAIGGAFLLRPHASDAPPIGTRAAPPVAAAAPPVSTAATRFVVEDAGRATFVIDAPLEKFKGRSTKFRGTLDVDVRDLAKSTGEVDLDLDDLKTETFGDKEKDSAQTEHAHNWLEIGGDVPAKQREDNHWARFTIRSFEQTSPARLVDAPEVSGLRTVKVVARGDMWLHGVTSPKTVKLTATFRGPPEAPTSIRIVSDEPIRVSMKEHDVKPRDIAGRFLSGALERVGRKIDDAIQVSIDLSAKRSNSS